MGEMRSPPFHSLWIFQSCILLKKSLKNQNVGCSFIEFKLWFRMHFLLTVMSKIHGVSSNCLSKMFNLYREKRKTILVGHKTEGRKLHCNCIRAGAQHGKEQKCSLINIKCKTCPGDSGEPRQVRGWLGCLWKGLDIRVTTQWMDPTPLHPPLTPTPKTQN